MPQIATYVGLVHRSEQTLADSLCTVADGHAQDADVFHTCRLLASMSAGHITALEPVAQRYHEQRAGEDLHEPERLHAATLESTRRGQIGLLRDLQDLHLLATLVQTTWTVLAQGAQGLRDRELLDIANHCSSETSRQLSWLTTTIKAVAPQALIASDDAATD
jgi:hypothetical protein